MSARRERKVVTVVFCDLVGFTARAESLDPEDVDAFLGPYHERVRSELERHGGTVEKFIGDAVMALFGAPTAHEDDPERAVRAALAIRDFALEEELELRVGITTGEALVRLDALPGAGEGMASGDVVNTAARLQSAAPVNGILVDETTYRATRSSVDYEDAEPIEAKGKSRPVTVWFAAEARSRFGVDVAHEARSELVGRERELAVVRDAFDRARHDRTPQLVTLVGVPGIGKSRLVYELREIADADPEIITWRQGRCLAYGEGVTLWALGEIVKAQTGIVEQDSQDQVAEKIVRAVSEALAGSGDEAWVASHLLALVGLGEDAELGGDRRGEAFAAWRRYLEALAEQRPLVLVFEDLHWADESLLDFVDELCDWITDVPLLVVGTSRPELLERRPGWGGGKLNTTTLALSPLSDEQTAALLAQLLGRSVLAADPQRALLEHAGGNPLYAEQFADLFVERGSADDLPLPESLQGIIAARLDALSPVEKELLQEASVLGKVFWASALGGDPGGLTTPLHGLERKGFVRRQKRSSLEGESEFAFAHALVRDVAYGQIARADRATSHRRVAEWIEGLGRVEDHAELLAHHWRNALELTRAAGADDPELVRRTRFALRDAGDRALALKAYAVAAAQYEDALALWPEDADRPDLLFRRARALFSAYDEARRGDALEEARDAFLAAGDRVRAGEAEAFLANVAWDRGSSSEVMERLARARALVGDAVSPSAARAYASSGRVLLIADEIDEGRTYAEVALAMTEELGLDELRAHALTTVGMAKSYEGDRTGLADMERALALALEIDSPVASAITNNLAVQVLIAGDIARGDELYTEAARLAERFGDASAARFMRSNCLWASFARGRWAEALTEADAFIAECEAGSPHTSEPNVRMVRGIMRLARGDLDGARVDHERMLELARDKGDPEHVLSGLAVSAAYFVEVGELERARALVEELVELTRARGVHGGLTRVAPHAYRVGLADELREALVAAPGVRAERWRNVLVRALSDDLRGAADELAAMGSPLFSAELRRHAGLRLLEAGRRAEAEQELRQALDFYESVDATAYVAAIRELLGEGAYSESA